MSGDLVSLRLLLISAVPSEQNLWRQGAAMASVPIDFSAADAAAAAGKTLAKGGVDICVIDSKLEIDDKEAALNAARAVEPAPFVVLSAPNARGTARRQRRHLDQASRMPRTRASSSNFASG